MASGAMRMPHWLAASSYDLQVRFKTAQPMSLDVTKLADVELTLQESRCKRHRPALICRGGQGQEIENAASEGRGAVAQIFISHSAKDVDFINFFLKAFAPSGVQARLEEFEKIVRGAITPASILQDIRASRAVFVILSQNVQSLSHTRDWVVAESAFGAALRKDIWVFEPLAQLGNITVVTPFVSHYSLFHTSDGKIQDYYFRHLSAIIRSYRGRRVNRAIDPEICSTALTLADASELKSVPITAAWASHAAADGVPKGKIVSCPACQATYSIHVLGSVFRCPVCNKYLKEAASHSLPSASAWASNFGLISEREAPTGAGGREVV
jgi:hypothetical protein